MLARLDEIPGVAESRVDWTGRRFLLGLEPGAEPTRVAQEAAATLGDGALVLGEEQTRAALGARLAGEAWMRAGETLRLSRHEAGVLAERHGEEAAREMGLADRAVPQLVELFERELARAFERTHGAPGSGRVQEEVDTAARRILESARRFLDAEQLAALEGYLARFAGPSEP